MATSRGVTDVNVIDILSRQQLREHRFDRVITDVHLLAEAVARSVLHQRYPVPAVEVSGLLHAFDEVG